MLCIYLGMYNQPSHAKVFKLNSLFSLPKWDLKRDHLLLISEAATSAYMALRKKKKPYKDKDLKIIPISSNTMWKLGANLALNSDANFVSVI